MTETINLIREQKFMIDSCTPSIPMMTLMKVQETTINAQIHELKVSPIGIATLINEQKSMIEVHKTSSLAKIASIKVENYILEAQKIASKIASLGITTLINEQKSMIEAYKLASRVLPSGIDGIIKEKKSKIKIDTNETEEKKLISKFDAVLTDLNNPNFHESSSQNPKYKTFNPEREAIEEIVDILSNPSNPKWKIKIKEILAKNKKKFKVLSIIMTFVFVFFQDTIESFRSQAEKAVISYLKNEIQVLVQETESLNNNEKEKTIPFFFDSNLDVHFILDKYYKDKN